VYSAFPYANLEIVTHIKPLVGVRVLPGCFLSLKKELYGLKQASRAWYQLVIGVLIDFGFTKCVSDPCIFFLKRGKNMVMVGVYVDDILIAGNNHALINGFKGYIEYHFKIKDMGSVKTMLGINRPLGKELKVKFVETTPMIPGQVLSSQSDLAENKVRDPRYVNASKLPYMHLVRCLLYVMTCTRPDISFHNCNFQFYG
jgi:Reverse transcriptase (RNA-dependent DNA polymerase)